MKHPLHRLISVVLLLALASSLFPASAAQASVKIGDQLFSTLSDAVAQAQEGDVIELLSDCTVSETIVFPSGITLDGYHYQLTLSSTACLQASGDLTLCNLSILMNRNARSDAPFTLTGEHAQYELSNVVIDCPNTSRPPHSTELLTFSAQNSSLTLEQCKFSSSMDQSTGILLTGDCSGSSLSLYESDIRIEPQSGASSSGTAINIKASGSVELTADSCTFQASFTAIASDEQQSGMQATLTNCQLYASTPLYICASGGTYEISDCTLNDEQTNSDKFSGLLFLGQTAQDNTFSIADTSLESGSESAFSCVFSIQNTQNEISISDHSAVSIASDTLDLIHTEDKLSTQTNVSADDSVDLSAFPIVWYDADDRLRNASTSLCAAAPVWQAGDTVTLRGAVNGAIDLQVPVTILGEHASFSGSLAVRAPGTVIHELDLSNSAVDCVAGCDLSRNYWGTQSPPASAITSPLYADADLSELVYTQVPDDQAAQEIDYFITEIQNILSQAIPGCTLETFDPLTDGNALTSYAEELRALCTRLSQSTTDAQRDAILSASPVQQSRMELAWHVYWAGIECNTTNSTVTLSPTLDPPGSDALHTLMTQNTAANQPICGISVDGTEIDPEQTISVHSTLTDWEFNSQEQVQSLTFETELRTDQGTVVTGDGTYRLPLPTQDCESVQATINQSTTTLFPEYSVEKYAYVTLSELGTIKLTLSQSDEPTDPEEPDPPTDPEEPTEPEETYYTITLRGNTHGTLRLRTPSEATQGETVKIMVLPDDDYQLDTLDVLDARGRSIDFDLSDDTLRFTMPASNVRVTARFVRTETESEVIPDDEPTLPSDVADDAWYQEAVLQAVEQGFMTPLLIGQFCPDLPTARGDLITALYRMAGEPTASAPAFIDIPSDSAYYSASIWARATGIAIGEPDGRFRPYDTVTREECVALLYRFCGIPPVVQTALPFSDFSSVSGWARPAMCWAYQSGILYGNAEGTCTPLAAVTRAETAALLMRLSQ